MLDAKLSDETKQQLNDLLEEFSDIMSKNSTSVSSKPYDLLLKHHKFIREELMNLLETGLIERSLSPYAAPIIVVPRKAPPGSS